MVDVKTGQEGFLVALTDRECRALMHERRALVFQGNGHPAVTVIAAATDDDAIAVMREYAASLDGDVEEPDV
jgi:hypothetical protein